MPQKKNPDPFEIIRGKTGLSNWNFPIAFFNCKRTPSGYSRDLQEIKPLLWKISLDT